MRTAAGGEKQSVIGKGFTALGYHLGATGIDPRRSILQQYLYPLCLIGTTALQRDLCRALLAADQKRNHRPEIGGIHLLAQHPDRAPGIEPSNGFGGGHSGGAAADNHIAFTFHGHYPPFPASMAREAVCL